MGHVTRRFYYILLKTVPYRSDPFQMDIAHWIRAEWLNEPNRAKPLKKPEWIFAFRLVIL